MQDGWYLEGNAKKDGRRPNFSIWLNCRSWEAHSHNYRHFVRVPQRLELNTKFPHKAWVDPGEGSFTCQVNCREWGSNCDCLCSSRRLYPLYHSSYSENCLPAIRNIFSWSDTLNRQTFADRNFCEQKLSQTRTFADFTDFSPIREVCPTNCLIRESLCPRNISK